MTKVNKGKKKEYVTEDLQQRIDFTEWLRKNPKMRPKRKRSKTKAQKSNKK